MPEPTTIIHTYKRKVHGRGHDHSGSQHDLHHNDKLSKSTGIDANKLYEEIIVVKDISTEQGPKASIDWMQILNEEYKWENVRKLKSHLDLVKKIGILRWYMNRILFLNDEIFNDLNV